MNESFKDRLKSDNTFVQSHEFTHQQLAEPLFAVMDILDQIGDQRFNNFTYRGQHYRAEYTRYRGFQESLFNDGLMVDRDFTVTNLGTKKMLRFSPLVPYYIARYASTKVSRSIELNQRPSSMSFSFVRVEDEQ